MPSTQTPQEVAQIGTIIYFRLIDWIALVVLIIGGLNWGTIGFFNLDFVSAVFGVGTTMTRLIYAIVGITAFYGIFLCIRTCRRLG